MKRRACKRLLTAAVLCAALTVPAKAARRSVPVQIDGNPIAVSAYVERGVTYVPLRALLNTMGAWDVWWDEATGRAAAASDDTHLWADPAADTVTVDEKTVRGRVTVENGATYVPLRLVGEALGCQVEWDPYLGGAAVTSPGAAYDAGELYWLSRIICAESGAESMSGQIAVGNVILNRVRSSSFPNTVEGVIFDRKDAVQFEPVSNGGSICRLRHSRWRPPSGRWTGKMLSAPPCISTPRLYRRGCGSTPTDPISRPSAAIGSTGDTGLEGASYT